MLHFIKGLKACYIVFDKKKTDTSKNKKNYNPPPKMVEMFEIPWF